MEYVIVYLIKGKAEKLQQKLVKTVGPKFGENYKVENPWPAHVTLKNPFKIKNIKRLESTMVEFVKKCKQEKITITGFGNFNKFVVFLKTNFSQHSRKIQKELIKEIKKLGIEITKFDKNFSPHSTIAYGNTKETFSKIWNYLKTLPKPKFNLIFDNITILRKNKFWEVYKEYPIK